MELRVTFREKLKFIIYFWWS